MAASGKTGRRKGDVPKQTRGWDDLHQTTIALRSKEESADYRYFPDPDLVTVFTESQQIDNIRRGLGQLPHALRETLQQDYQLPAYDAEVIVNQGRSLVDYFLQIAEATGDAKQTSNWLQQHVLRTLNEQQIRIDQFPLSAERMIDLLSIVNSGQLDNSRAREVFTAMLDNRLSARATMDELGIKQVDTCELKSLCQTLLDENPQIAADYRGGKKQAIGALIGRAKKVNPNVSPDAVRQTLIELLES